MKCSFKLLLVVILICYTQLYSADKKEYAVKNIPKEYMTADAVIRIRYFNLEIQSKKKANLRVTEAVTIFKKSEESYGQFSEYYNEFIEIENLEGNIYNADGRLIRELDSKDIKDASAVSNYSLYEDTRIKTAELYHNVYPYTVEFIYELSYDGYLGFPEWYARKNVDPVEKSSLTVIAHDNNLRYCCNQDTIKPIITVNGNITAYTWNVNNLPELSRDATGDYIEDVVPIVYIAPVEFELDDYSGNMNSWKDFGFWYRKLIYKRDRLPESALAEINTLYSTKDDDRSKVIKLYKYFQARTRYISIQLGIGGWQPFDAEFVHTRGYGDCKAVANYMMSLLQAAGITSYPVLINSGKSRYPMITEFPSNQFNHVILCVPLDNDTIWLECTNSSAPAGYLGPGNENRNALLITSKGGVVVKTPITNSAENLQERKVNVNIRATGTAEVYSSVKWLGNQKGNVQQMLDHNSPADREKWVLNSIDNPDCRIDVLKFTAHEDKSRIDLIFNYTAPRYSNISNNRIFFNPNILERQNWIPNDIAKRLSPVIFTYPYKDVDTIYYNIPEGYKIESLPQEVKLSISAIEYKSKVQVISDSKLIYIRVFEIKDYSLKAEEYKDYRKFYTDVVNADRSMVVLVKKN